MWNCSLLHAFTTQHLIALQKSWQVWQAKRVISFPLSLVIPLQALCIFNELVVQALYRVVLFWLVRLLQLFRKLTKYVLQIFSSEYNCDPMWSKLSQPMRRYLTNDRMANEYHKLHLAQVSSTTQHRHAHLTRSCVKCFSNWSGLDWLKLNLRNTNSHGQMTLGS